MGSHYADAYMVRRIHGYDRVFIDIEGDVAAQNLEECNRIFWKLYEQHRQPSSEFQKKALVCQKLRNVICHEMPNATLLPKGSTVNNLGTVSSDLDMCLLVLDSRGNTYDSDISFEVLEAVEQILKRDNSIKSIQFIDARVPILKVEMNDPYGRFATDITCNCLIGVFNSHMLSYYSRLDSRFPALATLVKQHAKEASVIDSKNGRLNSYAVVLMIIHYLQCVVDPPILPNLMKLFPNMFDGKCDPRKLRYDCNLVLPEIPKNTRTLAELAYGFYNYYVQFDYKNDAISIYDGRVFDRSRQPKFDQSFAFFLEEPYERCTAARSLTNDSLNETTDAFRTARNAIHKDIHGYTSKTVG